MADKSTGLVTTRDQGSAGGATEPMLETTTRTFDSTWESIHRAEGEVREVARRSGFQETILERICLAVHEIMINAIVHGNGGDPHKKVVVTISRTPDKLTIVIADEGEGFDPDLLPDPLSPEGLLKGLAVVSTWLVRLWTNSTFNANLWAGLW
jgi:serine/threonine-protein kinase RsbW